MSDSEQVVTPVEIATLRGTISQMEEANREAKSKRFLDALKEHNNNNLCTASYFYDVWN